MQSEFFAGAKIDITLDNRIWIVQEGSVDLFIQFDGQRLEPLFTVSKHQAIFPMVQTDVVAPFRMLIRLSPDAKITELSMRSITTTDFAVFVETWIDRLFTSWSTDFIVSDEIEVVEVAIGTGEQEIWFEHMLQSEKLYWLQPIECSVYYHKREQIMDYTAGQWIPISKQQSVYCPSSNKYHVCATVDLLEQGSVKVEQLLEIVHQTVLQRVSSSIHERLQFENQQVIHRLSNDQQLRNEANEQLAALVKQKQPNDAKHQTRESALFFACQKVTEFLGVSLQELQHDVSNDKIEEQLKQILYPSNIRSRQVLLAADWWEEDHGPLLAFSSSQEPVALIPSSSNSYWYYDAVTGEKQPLTGAKARTYQPFAYSLYAPLPYRALNLLDLLKHVVSTSIRQDLRMIVLMFVMSGVIGLALPVATRLLFERIIPESAHTQLWAMSFVLIVSAFASFCFQLTESVSILRIKGQANSRLQSAIWDRLLNLPVPFFRQFSSGDLAMRAYSINEIFQLLSGSIVVTVMSSCVSLFSFVLLFYFSKSLAMVAVVIVLVYVAFFMMCSWVALKYNRQFAELEGKLNNLVRELLSGIAKLRVIGAEERAYYIWAKNFQQQRLQAIQLAKINQLTEAVKVTFPIIMSIVLYIVMAEQLQDVTIGTFLGFTAAFTTFTTAMLGLGVTVMEMMKVIPLYERALPILTTVPEVSDDKQQSGRLSGAIEVSHISFRYHEDGPLILDDLSFQVQPGEFLAIVGSSGSGKSTLLRILLGFEKISQGAIYYDRYDLSEVNIQSVRRQMGVVLQNAQLMPGDIYSNIVGSTNADMKAAWEAARIAGLEEDIQKMPMGMHTVMNEGAQTISGGQRQRLLIARAIVHKPSILFLDEATSALDNQSQAIVSQNIEKLKMTRIAIAHRLSTIQGADRILVLDKGKIVEQGNFQQLMAKNGLFAQLVKRQM